MVGITRPVASVPTNIGARIAATIAITDRKSSSTKFACQTTSAVSPPPKAGPISGAMAIAPRSSAITRAESVAAVTLFRTVG